jgi:integrase
VRDAGAPAPPAACRERARCAALARRLDAGENIKALSTYLGHSDPGFTLRVHTHLMPSSEERTRRAIDDLFGSNDGGPDVLDMS